MKRNYKLFLQDIIDAMESIQEFLGDMNLNELINDDKTSSAIIMKFGIIGEATKHLPDELKEKHPEIPWKNMSGMRDRLIHAYFGIDHDLVWKAIETEIPKLKPQLKKILREFEKE
jgi:uncharacterized protein with HEPN domain